jgi:indolepyruvate ferredoxin oxidoreductase beta subunit
VTSEVRFGAKVDSPMIPFGDTDVLIVLTQNQVDIVRALLRADGALIEPSMIDQSALTNRKSLNVALLGVASAHLPFEPADWLAAIERALPEKLWAANHEAFALGQSIGQSLAPKEPRHV